MSYTATTYVVIPMRTMNREIRTSRVEVQGSVALVSHASCSLESYIVGRLHEQKQSGEFLGISPSNITVRFIKASGTLFGLRPCLTR